MLFDQILVEFSSIFLGGSQTEQICLEASLCVIQFWSIELSLKCPHHLRVDRIAWRPMSGVRGSARPSRLADISKLTKIFILISKKNAAMLSTYT